MKRKAGSALRHGPRSRDIVKNAHPKNIKARLIIVHHGERRGRQLSERRLWVGSREYSFPPKMRVARLQTRVL